MWEWAIKLVKGDDLEPQVECWPRGGGKSSTVELIVTYIGSMIKPARNFALYVCDTQEQADKHVGSISTNLQEIGIERALTIYGHSKGWKANQLRCANGFSVVALGLDTAARGIKLDNFRPDIIIFDDVDSDEDTPKTIEKKLRAIRKKIIAAGSTNCAVLFIQNMISDRGIMHSLVKGTAKWLLNRNVGEVEPAVWGLETEKVLNEDGKSLWKITAGKASWPGQDLAVCEKQINDWGLDVFLMESQHEVEDPGDKRLFKPWQFEDRFILPKDVPVGIGESYRGWDTATGEKQTNDNSATAKAVYTKTEDLYLRGFAEGKINTSKILEWAAEIIEREPSTYQIVEEANIGPAIYGYMQRKGGMWAKLCLSQPIKAQHGDKRKRCLPLAAMANERKVWIVMEGAWEAFVDELYAFTGIKENNEKDNLIDAVTVVMTYLKETPTRGPSDAQQSQYAKKLKKLIRA